MRSIKVGQIPIPSTTMPIPSRVNNMDGWLNGDYLAAIPDVPALEDSMRTPDTPDSGDISQLTSIVFQ
jgi:hypothetical protein